MKHLVQINNLPIQFLMTCEKVISEASQKAENIRNEDKEKQKAFL